MQNIDFLKISYPNNDLLSCRVIIGFLLLFMNFQAITLRFVKEKLKHRCSEYILQSTLPSRFLTDRLIRTFNSEPLKNLRKE
jgi:hypothetical protein